MIHSPDIDTLLNGTTVPKDGISAEQEVTAVDVASDLKDGISDEQEVTAVEIASDLHRYAP